MTAFNFNSETICGFYVSEKRKRVWYIQLEMVKEVVRICDKYNLKYIASGGTLLGAIRHNGYIPWDDDIDLMMPRKDYEKFKTVAQTELPENLFLQCCETEQLYPNGHLQIRNCNTTCLLTSSFIDLRLGKNCGIFVDVFPYDYVDDDIKNRGKESKKILRLKQKVSRYTCGKYGKSTFKNIIKKLLYCNFLCGNVEKTIPKIDLVSSQHVPTNTVALISFMPGYEKNVWRKEWFDETILHTFCDIDIAIPKHYDEVLRTEFGDYMQIPADKGGGSIHGKCFFDTEKSYLGYKDLDENNLMSLIKKFKL